MDWGASVDLTDEFTNIGTEYISENVDNFQFVDCGMPEDIQHAELDAIDPVLSNVSLQNEDQDAATRIKIHNNIIISPPAVNIQNDMSEDASQSSADLTENCFEDLIMDRLTSSPKPVQREIPFKKTVPEHIKKIQDGKTIVLSQLKRKRSPQLSPIKPVLPTKILESPSESPPTSGLSKNVKKPKLQMNETITKTPKISTAIPATSQKSPPKSKEKPITLSCSKSDGKVVVSSGLLQQLTTSTAPVVINIPGKGQVELTEEHKKMIKSQFQQLLKKHSNGEKDSSEESPKGKVPKLTKAPKPIVITTSASAQSSEKAQPKSDKNRSDLIESPIKRGVSSENIPLITNVKTLAPKQIFDISNFNGERPQIIVVHDDDDIIIVENDEPVENTPSGDVVPIEAPTRTKTKQNNKKKSEISDNVDKIIESVVKDINGDNLKPQARAQAPRVYEKKHIRLSHPILITPERPCPELSPLNCESKATISTENRPYAKKRNQLSHPILTTPEITHPEEVSLGVRSRTTINTESRGYAKKRKQSISHPTSTTPEITSPEASSLNSGSKVTTNSGHITFTHQNSGIKGKVIVKSIDKLRPLPKEASQPIIKNAGSFKQSLESFSNEKSNETIQDISRPSKYDARYDIVENFYRRLTDSSNPKKRGPKRKTYTPGKSPSNLFINNESRNTNAEPPELIYWNESNKLPPNRPHPAFFDMKYCWNPSKTKHDSFFIGFKQAEVQKSVKCLKTVRKQVIAEDWDLKKSMDFKHLLEMLRKEESLKMLANIRLVEIDKIAKVKLPSTFESHKKLPEKKAKESAPEINNVESSSEDDLLLPTREVAFDPESVQPTVRRGRKRKHNFMNRTEQRKMRKLIKGYKKNITLTKELNKKKAEESSVPSTSKVKEIITNTKRSIKKNNFVMVPCYVELTRIEDMPSSNVYLKSKSKVCYMFFEKTIKSAFECMQKLSPDKPLVVLSEEHLPNLSSYTDHKKYNIVYVVDLKKPFPDVLFQCRPFIVSVEAGHVFLIEYCMLIMHLQRNFPNVIRYKNNVQRYLL